LLSSIVLTGINNSLSKDENFQKLLAAYSEDTTLEIKLTVNDIEIDVKSFVENWQKQVKGMIAENAKELQKEAFGDINELLYELEGRLKEEVDARMEDWEKEDDENEKKT